MLMGGEAMSVSQVRFDRITVLHRRHGIPAKACSCICQASLLIITGLIPTDVSLLYGVPAAEVNFLERLQKNVQVSSRAAMLMMRELFSISAGKGSRHTWDL
jgi:hypothetical protein